MTDAIELLIKQAELKKLQLQISHQFSRNMLLFEQRFPTIHAKFKGYRPSTIELKLDHRQHLNLFNKAENNFIYADPAPLFCQKQVEYFKQSPYINRLRIGTSKSYNDRHLHIRYINELIEDYDREKVTSSFSSRGIITNLVITGIGIGYHLPTLLEELDIYNLFLYESSLDIFYACLHVIDWQPILDYFKQKNRSINFCLGFAPDRALIEIEQSINRIGLHNHVFTFIYTHTKSAEERSFLEYYKKEINNSASGLGYYDDEQIGFAHTMANLRLHHPVFISAKNPKIELPPALVIGNGPSLDIHIPFIQENLGKSFVFSCGTSFGSLSKSDIKPDFHVEMERTISMKDLLDFGTTQEDRKDVTLLCLNPIAPETISSFDEVCLALKSNDIGESIMQDYYHPQKILKLPFSNPTVSNSALAFAISMGFKEIYLVGVDLGLTEQGQHHSTNSPHYDLHEHIEDIKEVIYTYSDDNFKAKGNFGGEVSTHSTLNRARISIERLLHFTKMAHPTFHCFNSNNGAYIEGTNTIKMENIRPFGEIDKPSILKNIKDNNFYYHINKKYEKNKKTAPLKYFYSIEKKIKLKTSISSAYQFHQEAQRIYKLIDKSNDNITYMLLRGTVNLFLGLIMENSAYCLDTQTYVTQVNKGIKKYNALMEHIYRNMKSEPFKLDDTHNVTLHRLNQEKNKTQKTQGKETHKVEH